MEQKSNINLDKIRRPHLHLEEISQRDSKGYLFHDINGIRDYADRKFRIENRPYYTLSDWSRIAAEHFGDRLSDGSLSSNLFLFAFGGVIFSFGVGLLAKDYFKKIYSSNKKEDNLSKN